MYMLASTCCNVTSQSIVTRCDLRCASTSVILFYKQEKCHLFLNQDLLSFCSSFQFFFTNRGRMQDLFGVKCSDVIYCSSLVLAQMTMIF